jgi:hypothetical protein
VVAVRTYARADTRDRSVARWSAVRERRARQQLRLRLVTARALADGRTGPLTAGAADTVDVPPVRHRHHAIWLY